MLALHVAINGDEPTLAGLPGPGSRWLTVRLLGAAYDVQVPRAVRLRGVDEPAGDPSIHQRWLERRLEIGDRVRVWVAPTTAVSAPTVTSVIPPMTLELLTNLLHRAQRDLEARERDPVAPIAAPRPNPGGRRVGGWTFPDQSPDACLRVCVDGARPCVAGIPGKAMIFAQVELRPHGEQGRVLCSPGRVSVYGANENEVDTPVYTWRRKWLAVGQHVEITAVDGVKSGAAWLDAPPTPAAELATLRRAVLRRERELRDLITRQSGGR